MTDPGFDWRQPDREDPLRLSVRPAPELLLLTQAEPIVPAAATPTEPFFAREPRLQGQLARPVLEAARLDGQDRAERAGERASWTARATELRAGLPEGALEAAQQRRADRERPTLPGYFATPPGQRPAGARPGAEDWVGLYGYEMHGQQQLGGARGIEGRAAAAIQRRAALGLEGAYRDLPPEGRNEAFGGQLAALSEWPLGGQVSQAVLARLPGGERATVQGAFTGAQGQRRVLAGQDARALELQGLEGQLDGVPTPLSARLPAGLPADVRRQLQLGLNTGPGGFGPAGAALGFQAGGETEGGTQVSARVRRERSGSVPDTASLPNAETAGTVARASGKKAAPTAVPDKAPVEAKKKVTPEGKAAKKSAQDPGRTAATAKPGTKTAAGQGASAKKAPRKAAGQAKVDGGNAAGKGQAGEAGGQAAGGPQALRAVPLAQLPKGLAAKPVMQVEGSALFDLGQWKQLEAQEAQKAKLARAARARPVAAFAAPSGGRSAAPAQSSFGAPPVSAPTRAAPKATPLKKLGHTVTAAQLKAAEAQERKAAEAAMHAFVTRSQAKVKALDATKRAIAPKVQGAAKQAQATVAGAARTATAQLASAAASATGKARAAAGAARAKIQAEFASTSSAIKSTTTSSRAAVTAAHTAAVAAFAKGLTSLNTATAKEFTDAQAKAHSIGNTVGGEALAKGNQRAAQYAAEPLAHQSGWDDFVNGDDYPAKKRQAKVDAAKQVGQGYHDSLVKNADEYAAKIPEGQAKVQEGNQKLHDEYLKSLDQQHESSLTALQQAETQAIQSATQARDQQLQAVAQQLSQAVAGINQQRGALTGQVQQQASSQQAAIAKSASGSVSALQKAADTAISGLHKQISGIQGQLKGKGVPDSAALKAQLAKADEQIAGGIAAAKTSIAGSAQKSAAGLSSQAGTASSGLLATARQGAQGMNQAGTQAAQAANQLATTAAQGLKKLSTGFKTAAKQMVDKVKQGVQTLQKNFEADSTKITTGVRDQMTQSATAFEADMRKGMADEDAKITEEANKAADKVQPRWKGWVSILIDIVIAIAVTALVIATGGVAGIVLGIVAGAVGGVLGQLAKDGLNGELSSWQTYAAAALGGAIGGAVGAGGGALSTKLATMAGEKMLAMGAGKIASTAVKVGVDFVGNNITGLAGQAVSGFINNKAFGTPFSLADVFSVKSIAQNALMTGVGMGAGKYFESNPGMINRMRGLVGAGPKVEVKVPTPGEGTRVSAPEVKVPTAEAPTTTGPKAEPTTTGPKAETTGTGREPPVPPATREAPSSSEAPRPRETGKGESRRTPPPGEGLPPTPKLSTESGGVPKETAPTSRETATPREAAPSTGSEPTSAPREGSQTPKRSGRETGEAGKKFEEQVQSETGGKSEIIEGREIDSVTDEALIQAKDVNTDNPKNFLSKATRRQIKETVRMAGERGKRAEFHFKNEPHPDVVKYIEERGGYVVSPGRPRPVPGTPPRTPVVEPNVAREQTGKGPEENGPDLGEGTAPTAPKGPTGPKPGPDLGALSEGTETTGARSEGTESPITDPGLSERGYRPQPGERATTRQEWQAQQHAERMARRQARAIEETNAIIDRKLGEIPEGPLKEQARQYLQQVEGLDFGTTHDQASFYSGRKNGLSNRELALAHMERGGSAIDGTPGGKALEELKLYEVFKEDTRIADIIWSKASQLYARGASGDVHLFVDGADPTRVFGTIERPLIEGNPNVGKWRQYENPGKPAEPAPSTPAAPKAPALSAEELSQGLPPGLREQVPLTVNPDLTGNTVRVRYEYENGLIKSVKLEAGPEATPRDVELHAQTVETMQRYMGLQGRVRSVLGRLVGLNGEPKLGTRAWEAKLELRKLDGIIEERQNALAASEDPAVRARLEAEIAGLDLQVKLHEDTLARMDQDPGAGYVAADNLSFGDLEGILTRYFGRGKRPSNFATDTLEALFGRQPELHDGNAQTLNHSTEAGRLSRNHIIGFLHERTIALNEMVGRTHDDMTARMEAKGQRPGDTSDAALEQALIDYLKAQYNVDHNLYVGVSGDNSSLGSLMRHARDARGRIDPQTDPVAFRDASRRLAEMAVDVPEGKAATDGGQPLTATDRESMRQIRDIEAQWDDILRLREEGRRLREGDLDPDAASQTYQSAIRWQDTLRIEIEALVAKVHTGTPEANASIREALTQAVQVELLLSEVLNGV